MPEPLLRINLAEVNEIWVTSADGSKGTVSSDSFSPDYAHFLGNDKQNVRDAAAHLGKALKAIRELGGVHFELCVPLTISGYVTPK